MIYLTKLVIIGLAFDFSEGPSEVAKEPKKLEAPEMKKAFDEMQ